MKRTLLPLIQIARLLISSNKTALLRGALLACVVLIMGASLLALSGWFILATGAAGLAGLGVAFDVFRPSAGVRFLALGRTAARYGERLLTHDATLRALAALRIDLLRRFAIRDGFALGRLRSTQALTRIIADVDALDGLLLRVVLPFGAALLTQIIVAAFLAAVAGWQVALPILVGFSMLGSLLALLLARRTLLPSDQFEAASQNLRRAMIDLIRDREALILNGALKQAEQQIATLEQDACTYAAQLDRADRFAGAVLQFLAAATAACAIFLGSQLFEAGSVSAPVAAIAFFACLALAETILPYRRGFTEIGRQASAAKRILDMGDSPAEPVSPPKEPIDWSVSVTTAAAEFSVKPGEAVALTGSSGSGKSTLLLRIAGLLPSDAVHIGGARPQDIPESLLRSHLTFVPQRSALVAGSIRDNLTLGAEASDSEMEQVLDSLGLLKVIAPRGGLDLKLGEAGEGLSGGQSKRLTIARAVLKRPKVLLLDEPNEGLDAATATMCLHAVRRLLPQTSLIVALHSQADHAVFDRRVPICRT
ncbi:ATP-binding cassette domain-containing protein [Epibacterium sp. SM1969]|uniref:ATP-binding cassette domain-containing protein n=1 Tax=Tritonibacter aquimaris TaxID=2663379 RepID=A0A844AZI6_9RHOB|nr:ATP-binding cassette domain-containing protein [Tritonibacter aquimaris]MQY42566.1 ATP-binding cassette domain-containing protein [Tritonibacter aquimaris]